MGCEIEELSRSEKTKQSIAYGCDELGRLKSVLIHTPGEELSLINESNYEYWLYDKVPDIPGYIKEHKSYQELLESNGVRVYELGDYVDENKDLIRKLPNLTFLHDIAVISDKGAILSKMRPPARQNEEIVVKEALNNLGIPILSEFNEGDGFFEGCLLLSKETIFVADTERHTYPFIQEFISNILKEFDEVIYTRVPKARRYMHPDTVFNRVREDLALAYLPAFEETCLFTEDSREKIDFKTFIQEEKGMGIISISDSEQSRLGCSFVPLESGTIFHYDTALDRETIKKLEKESVEIIPFHPDAMRAGGGSLRCHTLRLCRRKN
ncbi:arginine deiminase [Methanosarcina thermophila MST-A1]|jgi:arginine deiminase|uniref:Arginine deiminase n=1 Tax=Methanosarcina thermophila CHTI-55 TaxID=1434121 RepID=A0A0E3NH88_METTE|nr:dimethylarginine dimethylaminohydrolase family protein [Methanosarcina thermophila]AKB16294.1 Arginine deiminase [Methanosarcina thermophila CHTI-55]NLU56164.1 arginine deiminase [Methanosarcina thermophila]GLI14364.1 arginine deiminase [Methanosarcina thermophila MST-A1]